MIERDLIETETRESPGIESGIGSEAKKKTCPKAVKDREQTR
jgi:hypothetical protein